MDIPEYDEILGHPVAGFSQTPFVQCEARWIQQVAQFTSEMIVDAGGGGTRSYFSCMGQAVGKSSYWNDKTVCKACHEFGRRSRKAREFISPILDSLTHFIRHPDHSSKIKRIFHSAYLKASATNLPNPERLIFAYLQKHVDAMYPGKKLVERAYQMSRPQSTAAPQASASTARAGLGRPKGSVNDKKRKQSASQAGGAGKKTKGAKVESKYMKNKRLKEEAAAKAAGEGAKAAMAKGGKGVKTTKSGTTGRGRGKAATGTQGKKLPSKKGPSPTPGAGPKLKKPSRPQGMPTPPPNNSYMLFQGEEKGKAAKIAKSKAGNKESGKAPNSQMLAKMWKELKPVEKDKYKVKHAKLSEQYNKDLEAYKSKHPAEFARYEEAMEEFNKSRPSNKNKDKVNKAGGGKDAKGGDGGGGKKLAPARAPSLADGFWPLQDSAANGSHNSTSTENEESLFDEEGLLHAGHLDVDLAEESDALLEQVCPSDPTRAYYKELREMTDLLPKSWETLAVIPVRMLTKLMQSACVKRRSEIGLPVSTLAANNPYSRMSMAVDHLLRDMLEDLLALRNHRVESLKTARSLGPGNTMDMDGFSMDSILDEDTPLGRASSSGDASSKISNGTEQLAKSKKRAKPVQLRAVKISSSRDAPQLCLESLSREAANRKDDAKHIESQVRQAAPSDSPGSLIEMAESFLKERLEGQGELFGEGEFNIREKWATATPAAAGGGDDDDIGAGMEEDDQGDNGSICLQDLKVLLTRDPRFHEIAPATTHHLFSSNP